MTDEKSPVGSVDKALRILQLLSTQPRGITLEELVNQSGLPRSSLHRLLGALKHRGFAAQPEPNGRYLLGPEMLAAAFRFHERLDLPLLVRPLLVRLNTEFNETVHLGVLDGREIVYVDKVESSQAIKLTSVIGGRNPAHTTGLGKALLAWTYPTREALERWADAGELKRVTSHSIETIDKLEDELAKIRAAGYALDLGENEESVNCAAAPVFLGGSKPAAAISIAAPKQRMPLSRLERVADTLTKAISAELLSGQSPGLSV